MNLFIVPTVQSCSFIFFTEEKILEHTILDTSKTFSESIMRSDFWKNTQNIFFVSGPASFTTLRNMSVFLETLKNFSTHEKAEHKTYNFYNISTQNFLQQCITHKHNTTPFFLYSVGRREVFIFSLDTKKPYTKIKNTQYVEYINDNISSVVIGFLSENIETILTEHQREYINLGNTIDTYLNIQEIIEKKDTALFSRNISIDYGSLPTIG